MNRAKRFAVVEDTLSAPPLVLGEIPVDRIAVYRVPAAFVFVVQLARSW